MWTALLTSLANRWPIRRLLGYPLRRQMAKFNAAAQKPREVQEQLLRRILAFQKSTGFGRDHGFHQIQTVADYRRLLPILRYEDIEPYMARVRRGEWNALLADPCVHMFALTSGTTAARKYIPVTPQYLADYRRGWNLWGLKVFQDHPDVRLRPIVQLSGDWDELRTEAGVPCGALTGLTAQTQRRLVRWLYLVPACTGKITDAAAKYYVALRLSMARRVGILMAANPSTLVNMARAGDEQKEALLRDIHNGTLDPHLAIPAEVRAALVPYLKPRPERARELDAIAQRTGTLYPKDYWRPHRFLIATWTGGSVGAYVRHFPRYFGDAPVRDLGLLASEGRMTIPLADATPSGVLDVTSHYFEFIPEAEAEKPNPAVLSVDELEEGGQYFLVPTTAYGLYRYHIHDLIRVTGFHERTPQVEFLSKGAHFSSITGEKVSEYQVTAAMADVTRELDLSVTCYSLAPCWEEPAPYYGLFVEGSELATTDQAFRLAEALDRRLAAINSEYAAKRDSHRLAPIRLALLRAGAWQQWDRQRLARSGGSLEQYKHPCLIGDLKFRETVAVEREIRTDLTACKPS